MSTKDLKLPEHMKIESVETLRKIPENGYDYKKVDKVLTDATKSMLDNSSDLLNPRVVNVAPKPDFTLILEFSNRETRIFDMKNYLEKVIFHELKDVEYFNKVRVVMGKIQWPNGEDLCPDTLYLESILSK